MQALIKKAKDLEDKGDLEPDDDAELGRATGPRAGRSVVAAHAHVAHAAHRRSQRVVRRQAFVVVMVIEAGPRHPEPGQRRADRCRVQRAGWPQLTQRHASGVLRCREPVLDRLERTDVDDLLERSGGATALMQDDALARVGSLVLSPAHPSGRPRSHRTVIKRSRRAALAAAAVGRLLDSEVGHRPSATFGVRAQAVPCTPVRQNALELSLVACRRAIVALRPLPVMRRFAGRRRSAAELPALLSPLYREQLHQLRQIRRLPGLQDALHDVWRQQREPQNLGYVRLVDALRLCELGH